MLSTKIYDYYSPTYRACSHIYIIGIETTPKLKACLASINEHIASLKAAYFNPKVSINRHITDISARVQLAKCM